MLQGYNWKSAVLYLRFQKTKTWDENTTNRRRRNAGSESLPSPPRPSSTSASLLCSLSPLHKRRNRAQPMSYLAQNITHCTLLFKESYVNTATQIIIKYVFHWLHVKHDYLRWVKCLFCDFPPHFCTFSHLLLFPQFSTFPTLLSFFPFCYLSPSTVSTNDKSISSGGSDSLEHVLHTLPYARHVLVETLDPTLHGGHDDLRHEPSNELLGRQNVLRAHEGTPHGARVGCCTTITSSAHRTTVLRERVLRTTTLSREASLSPSISNASRTTNLNSSRA